MGWSQERGRKYSVQTRFWSMGQLVLCMHFRTCRAVVNLQVSPFRRQFCRCANFLHFFFPNSFFAIPSGTTSNRGKLGKISVKEPQTIQNHYLQCRSFFLQARVDSLDRNGLFWRCPKWDLSRTNHESRRVEKEAETIITRTVVPKFEHYLPGLLFLVKIQLIVYKEYSPSQLQWYLLQWHCIAIVTIFCPK